MAYIKFNPIQSVITERLLLSKCTIICYEVTRQSANNVNKNQIKTKVHDVK